MEVSSQEGGGEIPIPIINSSSTSNIYGGGGHGTNTTTNGHGHMNIHHHHIHQDHPHHPLLHHNHHHHNHIISPPSSAPPQNPSNGSSVQLLQPPPAAAAGGLEADHGPYNNNNNNSNKKKVVRYRECLKNHAAAMGGNATDGCGEFMPSGEEGTIEALNCSACHCHRNFHRKEVEGEPPCDYQQQYYNNNNNNFHSRKFILGHPLPHHNKNILSPDQALGYTAAATAGNILPSRSVPPHHMIMPFNYNIGASTSLPSESDEQEEDAAGGGGGVVVATRPSTAQLVVKKRFRTKFTQEQKEKMLSFADKVGWKIQKQEESLVQHFCQEIGVKRRVLKVWMHNNKHSLAKKNLPPPPPPTAA